MVGNLLKAPLIALFFGALLFFTGTFIPFSEEYGALTAEFPMPMIGYAFLLLLALWVTLLFGFALGSADRGGVKFILLTGLTMLGTAWGVPVLQSLLFYEQSVGIAAPWDTLMTAAAGALCTVLAIGLCLLVFKSGSAPENAPKPKFKLQIVPFAIKIIVLPIVYSILFYVAWYFLHWSGEEVRVFYGGHPENAGFVGSVVNSLVDSTWMLYLALIKGFAYVVLALPMMFLFPGKRVLYMVITVLNFLTPSIRMLMPDPLVPDNIRFSNLIYISVLVLVYGLLATFLLHTCWKKEEVPAPAEQPAQQLTPQQIAAARARAQQKNAAVKNAAAAVSTTMKGDAK